MQYIKYPRTEHLPGSKILDQSNFNRQLKDNNSCQFPLLPSSQSFVIEEKMDGIGLGIFFIEDQIHIQQRGHIFPLSETPEILKNFTSWTQYNEELLYCIVGNRYTLFGEWLEFKHTVFYNSLDSLFLEYDIFDHKENIFLSTPERHKLLQGQIASVKVIDTVGSLDLSFIHNLLLNHDSSHFNNSQWHLDYQKMITKFPQAAQDTLQQASYEGFYIKVESEKQTLDRFKWIRKEFFDIVEKNQHWKNKPLINNQLSSLIKPVLNF